ncbi:MAG: DegV family protein [Anaerolineae bacterium]|nr:DegV family protein [Anaerolineae bacterium]
MTIKIVTDSTCDLPADLIAEHDVSVIPLYINFGTESYQDGVDLSREEFYRKLPDYPVAPTTSAPGPEVFRCLYEKLADEGATEILSIHISENLSSTMGVAYLGTKATTRIPVTAFDSRQLSMGTGFLVLTAAKAAQAGQSMREILALIEDQIKRTHVFAALDTLEFLRRSGRMSWAASRLGSLLRIKPLLRMYDGEAQPHRVRTSTRAIDRLVTWLEELVPLEKIALLHALVPEQAEALRARVQHLAPDLKIPLLEINPVIGAHIGPGVLGFACVTRPE